MGDVDEVVAVEVLVLPPPGGQSVESALEEPRRERDLVLELGWRATVDEHASDEVSGGVLRGLVSLSDLRVGGRIAKDGAPREGIGLHEVEERLR